MTLDQCYQQYQGQSVSFDGIEANRGQCVQWVEIVHTQVYGAAPFYGNAIDWWNNFGGSLATTYDRTQDGSIRKGDIVVFNTNVGSIYGHIDVAMSDGDYNQFTGADTNWAGNKTVHLVNHVGAQYVLGVLRLKGGNIMNAMTETDLNYMHLDYMGVNLDKTTVGGAAFLGATLGQPFLTARDALATNPVHVDIMKRAADYATLQAQVVELQKQLADKGTVLKSGTYIVE